MSAPTFKPLFAELAATLIQNEAHPDANIIWGVGFDEDLEDEMQITIIATGFDKKEEANKKDDDVWGSLIGGGIKKK